MSVESKEKKRLRSELSSTSSSDSPSKTELKKPKCSSTDSIEGFVLGDQKMAITSEELKFMLDNLKQEIVKEIDLKINNYVTHLQEEIATLKQYNHSLGKKVDLIEKNHDQLESKIMDLEIKLDKLENSITSMDKVKEQSALEYDKLLSKIQEVKRNTVENEQYSRKSNFKVLGIRDEYKNEDTRARIINLCKEKLNIDIAEKEIDAAHRMGPRHRNGKDINRSIIVKCVRRDLKYKIIKARKLLKNSDIVIVDDLCYEMQQLFNRTKSDQMVQDSWTFNNKIFFKDLQNKVHSIHYGESVSDILQRKK